MLDDALRGQLRQYLTNLRVPVTLVASLDDSAKAAEMRALIEDIAALSDKVDARFDGIADRRPSFAITDAEDARRVEFAAIPLGHEFTSLVLALLHVGGHPPREDEGLLDTVRGLDAGALHFETFMSLTCQNCPDVVQALNIMAALNPRVRHTTIDGALFQDEVERRQVMAVPSVFLNGEPFGQGRMDLAQIVAKLDTGAAQAATARLNDEAPFEVLIVGGGPAGAAAAVYAARKGIRTGVIAERMGGQLNDSLGIENYPSIEHTEGPKLARDLEMHVRANDVPVFVNQTATGFEPADLDGLHRVKVGDASLAAKTVILATGARWRQLGVPGEEEYRNRGVAYCPHCDGPLYKGKRVAVVGGGNSGVEAAIDLAGIAAEVTLFEFDATLRADAVLQKKLASLPNATVHTSALTTEVKGDGSKVVALTWRDRESGEVHELPLEGVFVQIGLVPNSEWLGDTLERTQRGEIVIDDHGATSVPGVYAAGDVTTVPYKQIIVAAGEGSKAALGAFDHLIRS